MVNGTITPSKLLIEKLNPKRFEKVCNRPIGVLKVVFSRKVVGTMEVGYRGNFLGDSPKSAQMPHLKALYLVSAPLYRHRPKIRVN